MNPIDFEDARDAYHWMAIEDHLEFAMAARRRALEAKKHERIRKWRKHWRTRLSRWLLRLSLAVSIPAPYPVEEIDDAT